MKKLPKLPPTDVQQLLEHVHSLHIVSVPHEIGHNDVSRLLALGYLRQVWINNYTLTEAGKQARKGRRP